MNNVLLFIDTETSGLPKKWNRPYTETDNWPYAVQVSWLIYTTEGQLLQQRNFYIKNKDITISASAQQIHHITYEFLNENGKDRKEVLQLLAEDLTKYYPLVIGHFVELDIHVLGAEFYRAGMDNPLLQLPTFCTMLATKHLVQNPARKYLRLCDLYQFLFSTTLEHGHNALIDAKATANCFFELRKRGIINDAIIAQQQTQLHRALSKNKMTKHIIPVLIIFLLMILIVFYLWKTY